MQCYTDLTPPTAVTHSVSLPFLSAAANNLVVAKTSLLQIFSLKSVISDTNDRNKRQDAGINRPTVHGGDLDTPALNRKSHRGERIHTTKLVLVTQYELSGVVTALGRVKTMHSKSGGEVLLVALQDAKLSLVEWDSERYSISTISIHYYEREDLQGPPWSPEVGQCVNILTVDPSSRCAALKFGSRNIAILPFHQAGDDLVMDDYDPEVDTEITRPQSSPAKLTNGDTLPPPQTPHHTSFVLSLMILDPNLTHPIHLAFLHEYREPTFGVLSSRSAVSSALLHERQDTLSYTVYTLDLEQRASTTLLSVAGLPYDLHTILPLPLPVGGALLVGFNELIHVDQAGKTNGVAVNESARQCSSFPLPYLSELNLRLEGCVIEPFGTSNGELLLILNTGELAVLGFKQDGRTVSGLSLRRVAPRNGGSVLCTAASCSASIGRGRIFIGSEDGDSIVLGWARRSTKTKQRYSLKMEVDGEASASDLDEDELEDEDDLYAGSKPEGATQLEAPLPETNSEVDDYAFRIHDRLRNPAPLGDVIFKGAADPKVNAGIPLPSLLNLEMLVSSGRGRAGALCKVGRKIEPVVDDTFNLSDVYGVWPLHAQKSLTEGMAPDLADEKLDRYDNVLIVSGFSETGDEQSAVYELTSGHPEESPPNDFDTTGGTVEVGVFGGGTRIIQVLKSEIRTYDGGKCANLFSPVAICHTTFKQFSWGVQRGTDSLKICTKSVDDSRGWRLYGELYTGMMIAGASRLINPYLAYSSLSETCSIASIQYIIYHPLGP